MKEVKSFKGLLKTRISKSLKKYALETEQNQRASSKLAFKSLPCLPKLFNLFPGHFDIPLIPRRIKPTVGTGNLPSPQNSQSSLKKNPNDKKREQRFGPHPRPQNIGQKESEDDHLKVVKGAHPGINTQSSLSSTEGTKELHGRFFKAKGSLLKRLHTLRLTKPLDPLKEVVAIAP